MLVVTGGAGFIGSALVERLNRSGRHDILIVDNLGSSNKWRNLVGKRISSYLHKDQFINVLIRGGFKEKIDAIVHLGACTSTTEQNAEYLLQNNFTYTKVLAQWAIEKEIRFIYASSAATYGDGSKGFSDNNTDSLKLEPLNGYGLSKQLFDQWAIDNGFDQKIAGLKFFNVFGPNEYHKGDMASVVYKAFGQIKERGAVNLFRSYDSSYKDGEQLRDFIYVRDCVDVMIWLLENPGINGIYNLGTGKARSWNALASAVFAALEKPVSIHYIEMPENLRAKYQYFTEAKMDKLRAAGYSAPFTSLENGIADYIKTYLDQDYRVL